MNHVINCPVFITDTKVLDNPSLVRILCDFVPLTVSLNKYVYQMFTNSNIIVGIISKY